MRLPILLALSPLLVACPNSDPETTAGTDTSSEMTTGSTTDATETGSMIQCPQSQPLTDAEFVGGLVLPAGTCWTVDEHLTLSDGIVTVEEGVEIRFASNIKVSIKTGGQLTIAGTAEAPVLLGTADPLISWHGISMDDSQGSANAWAHVIVENAGSAQWNGASDSYAALWLDGSTTLSLSAVTFQKNVGRALRVNRDVALTAADLSGKARHGRSIMISRDWFLLGTQTSLRWSDWRSGRFRFVPLPDDGGYNLQIIQEKTDDPLEIPLSTLAIEILRRYDFNMPPCATPSTTLTHLRIIARAAGISKHITTHTARRTFCTLQEAAGVPRSVIMRITGHRTEKDYLRYTGITFRYNADMMRRANPKMFIVKSA